MSNNTALDGFSEWQTQNPDHKIQVGVYLFIIILKCDKGGLRQNCRGPLTFRLV